MRIKLKMALIPSVLCDSNAGLCQTHLYFYLCLFAEGALVQRLGGCIDGGSRWQLPELLVQFVAVLNAYSELNRCDKQKLYVN